MRRLFPLVAAVILLDTMFYSAITPLLPEFARDLGLSKTSAGILTAAYGAGTVLASLPAGFLAVRIGFRATMLAGLALLGTTSVVFAFATDIVVLDLARFAEGVGGALAWTGGFAWLLAAAPASRRGEVVGATVAAAIFGILLGPVIGATAAAAGKEAVFVGVALLAAGLAAWVAVTPGAAPTGPVRVRPVLAAIAKRPVVFAAWLVVLPSILSGAFDVLVPLRMDVLGATGAGIAAAFFAAAAFEALTAPVIGRFSDRRGRLVPIRLGLAACPVAALILPLPGSATLVALALIVVVLVMSLIWTPAMALLSDNAEAAGLDLAFASALVGLAWAGGQVVGGSAFAGLAELASDAAAYGLVAALFAVTLAVVLARAPAAPQLAPPGGG